MLEIGKMKPESIKVGRRVRRMESMKASCCDLVMVEI